MELAMPQPLDLTSHGMLALTRASLATLRTALLRDGGPDAAVYLQEAGYAGGDAMWEAFKRWLGERSDIPAESLDVEAFEQRATEFFRDAGWGSIAVGSIGDVPEPAASARDAGSAGRRPARGARASRADRRRNL